MIKLTVKQTGVTQAIFHERLLCFQCPNYKTTEKMFKNFTYDGKKRFAFCICGRPRNQKNTLSPPPPKKTVRDYLQNRTKFSGHQNFATRCEINAREISKTLRKHFDVLTASNSYWLYWLEQFRCFLKRLSVI